MDKEEALGDFIKGLRIAFANALAYPAHHPYFVKSVEEFKSKIEALFGFLNPIEVNISLDSLFIDDKCYSKSLTHIELSRLLHQRRIKKIEITPGLTTEELGNLLSALAFSPRDIIKSGGLKAILERAASRHIFIEELDYSSLLSPEGREEIKDVWRYLFKEAVLKKDAGRINEFAETFAHSIKNIGIQELIKDNSLKEDLGGFLAYLRENSKEKSLKCSSELLRRMFDSDESLSDEDIRLLKPLFSGLGEEEFAQILRLHLLHDEKSGPLFFKLFERITEGMNKDKIAGFLSKNIGSDLSVKKAMFLNKLKSLLADPKSESISPVYRNTLSIMLEGISFSEDYNLDPQELTKNYSFVLLNMLDKTDNSAKESFMLKRIKEGWSFISENKDYEYIKSLAQLLKSRKEKEAAAPDGLEDLESKISELIEEDIWREEVDANLSSLAKGLSKSCKGAQFYFDKIFEEKRISSTGLSLFFKFFPEKMDIFYSRIESQRNDLELMILIVKALTGIEPIIALQALKRIYSATNEIVKIEILKAMKDMPELDMGFLLGVLQGDARALKKEALRVLSREKEKEKKGIELLLNMRSPWGRNNNVILENMSIVEELGLKNAIAYLAVFSKLKLFWHHPLKKKARSILERL